MGYPREFYYNRKINREREVYGRTPPGQLNIQRLIKNIPAFKKLNSVADVEKNKKVLVLSDYAIKQRIINKKSEGIWLVLSALDAAGFHIYHAHSPSGKLEKIDTKKIWNSLADSLTITKPNIAPDEKVIKRAEATLGITKDRIAIINHHWLSVLLNEIKIEAIPELDTSDVLDDLVKHQLNKILKDSIPPIQKIRNSKFSEATNRIALECQQQYPEIPVIDEYTALCLTEKQLDHLVKNKELVLHGRKITWSNLKEIKSIELTGFFEEKDLAYESMLVLQQEASQSIKLSAPLIMDQINYAHTIAIYHANMWGWDDDERNTKIETREAKSVRHNRDRFFTHQPESEQFQFKFKGNKKTLDDSMVIEQLSQYLIVTQSRDRKFIPKIQDGICKVLSELFLKMTPMEFNQFLESIAAWNGTKAALDNTLAQHFKTILKGFRKHCVRASSDKKTVFAGNAIAELLANDQGAYILQNPWHEVAVKYSIEDKAWHYYNSNNSGIIKCSSNELATILEDSIGSLIDVVNPRHDFKPIINSINHFIAEGGLLSLVSCNNSDEILKLFSGNIAFDANELHGILLRSTSGEPAWIYGLQSANPRIQAFTINLLSQFKACYPSSYGEQLAKSIATISGMEKLAVAEILIKAKGFQNADPELLDIINAVSNFASHKELRETFVNKLQGSSEQSFNHYDPQGYCQSLASGVRKKCLIKLASSEAVTAMNLKLQKYCMSINRPCFYVNSPDDLTCQAASIKRNSDNTGKLVKRPSGAFYDFLMQNYYKDNPPLIIINYDNFSSDDIIHFNSMFDDIRKADGISVPEFATIVALIDRKKSDSYEGNDLTSRFPDAMDVCPFTQTDLMPVLPDISTATSTKAKKINLCHGDNWREKLLGQWIIKKDKLYFREGKLAKVLQSAIKRRVPVEIQNGLWEDPSFQYFWEEARTLGYFPVLGKKYPLDKIKFIKSEGYNWERLRQYAKFSHGVKTDNLYNLNPGMLQDYYYHYQCDNESKQLDTLNGLIKTHKNKSLSLNLTRELTEDQWAELLIECSKYNVKLDCYCTPGVDLPKELNPSWSVAPPAEPLVWKKLESSSAIVIRSSDADVTVNMITATERDWKIIDITECSDNDLIVNLDARFDENVPHFEFTETDCVLKQALANNENIILKGKFSPELIDKLAPVLLKKQSSPGQLVLVSDETNQFNFLPTEYHDVTFYEKIKILQQKLQKTISEDELAVLRNAKNETLSQWLARLAYPDVLQNKDPWQGLHGLSGDIQLQPFDLHDTEKESADFIKERKESVQAILKNSPYAYITGHTGVAKTTFVQKHLADDKTHLHMGEESIAIWADDNATDDLKVLFIDEVNMASRQWSMFEGLYNDPPGILINGQYKTLSKNHKVIFAGNPLNYGENREFPQFFHQHGNAIIFKPLPMAYIYEEILKPIFKGTMLEEKTAEISAELLSVYYYICERSSDKILISPRELEMMAMFILARTHHGYDLDVIQNMSHLPGHYAYHVAKSLVPAKYQTEFEEKFGHKQINVFPQNKPDDFILTESRYLLYQQISDLLKVSEYQRNYANNSQQFAGSLGMIIEGDSGEGKSKLVIANLIANGYQEATHATQKEKIFYSMPASMPYDEKIKLLLQAYKEGAIVVIDEINSTPMMERFLNLISASKNKDELIPKAGFKIIGTQNPVEQGGRYAMTDALARRFLTCTLPKYKPHEMKRIIIERGVDDEMANFMIKEYLNRVENDKKMTFRNLSNAVDDYLEACKRHSSNQKIILNEIRQHSSAFDAAKYGDVERLNELANKNIDLDESDSFGMTPLMYAAENNQIDCIQALLNAGVNIRKTDTFGLTPVMIAAKNNCIKSITLLAKAGCDVDATNKNGTTAAIFAAAKGFNETLLALKNAGADLEKADKFGITAKYIAAQNGYHLSALEGDITKPQTGKKLF